MVQYIYLMTLFPLWHSPPFSLWTVREVLSYSGTIWGRSTILVAASWKVFLKWFSR